MNDLLRWISNIFSTILLGDLKYRIATKEDLNPIRTSIQSLNHAVVEIQTILKDRGDIECKQHISILEYGQANSPISLKNVYKPIVIKSGLDENISVNSNKLVAWLKKQNPKTGLDAQDQIIKFVTTGEVEKYLDLTMYKQYLYEHGKTSHDADGILTVYLFEKIIPKLDLPKTKK